MSWREDVSQQAQDDLDRLTEEALSFAEHQLQAGRVLLPYGLGVANSGKLELLHDGQPVQPRTAAEVIAGTYALAQSRASLLRAFALTADVSDPASDGDAVRVLLEHRTGTSLTVFLPYTRRRGRLTYGELRASPGNPMVWPDQGR